MQQASRAVSTLLEARAELDAVEFGGGKGACNIAFKHLMAGQGSLQSAQENLINAGETTHPPGRKKSPAYQNWSTGERLIHSLGQRFGRLCVK